MVRPLRLMLILLSLSALLLVACGGETDPATNTTASGDRVTNSAETASQPESTTDENAVDSAEITDNTLTDIGDAVEAEVVAALEAGEELDPDALIDAAEDTIAEHLDEDKYGNVSESDLPLPLACDILSQVDLNDIVGAELSEQPTDVPSMDGAPFHVSICTYTNDWLNTDDPYLSASLTVRQPKPGAPIVSPDDALADFEAGAEVFFDEDVEIEPIDGFEGVAVYSMGTLSIFRPDGSMLTLIAGEGFEDRDTTVALASAVDALLRN